jgi:hypothetical protein
MKEHTISITVKRKNVRDAAAVFNDIKKTLKDNNVKGIYFNHGYKGLW